ncbi:MAG: glycosyltransferase [Planctomycetota bacterium]
MKISVVIPTYGRPDALRRCLEGLAAQRRLPDEVLVVVSADDASQSERVAREGVESLPVQVLTVPTSRLSGSLQAGIDTATGDVIAFTDDDAVARPDWLERIEGHLLADPGLGGIGGRDVVHEPPSETQSRGLVWRMPTSAVGQLGVTGRISGNHHLGSGLPRAVDVLKGVNMALRSGPLREIGIDPRLSGRGAQVAWEVGLCLAIRRCGRRLLFDPDVLVDHYPGPRVRGDHRQHRRYEDDRDAAFNEALGVLGNAGPGLALGFIAWSMVVGSRRYPGLLRGLLLWAMEFERGMVQRVRATLVGRWRACLEQRRARRAPGVSGEMSDAGRDGSVGKVWVASRSQAAASVAIGDQVSGLLAGLSAHRPVEPVELPGRDRAAVSTGLSPDRGLREASLWPWSRQGALHEVMGDSGPQSLLALVVDPSRWRGIELACWLPLAVWRLRRRLRKMRVAVVFVGDEVAVGRGASWCGRLGRAWLSRLSTVQAYPTEALASRWGGVTLRSGPMLPEPRPVERMGAVNGSDRVVRVGVLGARERDFVAVWVGQAARELAGQSVGVELVAFGASTALVAALPMGVSLRGVGGLKADEMMADLAGCDMAWAPYAEGVDTGRGWAVSALAAGVPLVSSLGERTGGLLSNEAGESLVLAEPSGDAFVSAVVGLMQDGANRRALGEAGRALYERSLEWSSSAGRFLEGIESLEGSAPDRQVSPEESLITDRDERVAVMGGKS